jgi:uncharacterized LabA/DUF88 family protein
MSATLLIDGENFKKKIQAVFDAEGRARPSWHTYDFRRLIDTVLRDTARAEETFYFAHIKAHPATREKSARLIEEQRLLKTHLERQGFAVRLSGRVRGQLETAANGRQTLVFKEKGVDVQLAVDMVRHACDGSADTLILGSSDSDLQPAIAEVRRRGLTCVYLGFENAPNRGLAYTSQRTILIHVLVRVRTRSPTLPLLCI